MKKEMDAMEYVARLKMRKELAEAVEEAKAQIKFGKWDQPGIPNFPTLSKCTVCEGYTRAYPNINEPLVAAVIAMIQHGYYIKAWEEMNCLNRENFPKPCTCECQHEFDEVSVGRCLHRWTCKKCGVSQVVDSSD